LPPCRFVLAEPYYHDFTTSPRCGRRIHLSGWKIAEKASIMGCRCRWSLFRLSLLRLSLCLLSSLLLGTVGSSSGWAQQVPLLGPAADLAEVYRPSLLPDRVILTWSDDPATTQAVTWRTSPEAGRPLAEITEARPGPDLEKNAQRVAGNSQPLTTDLGTAHYHSVQFDGLTPNTKYAYRVGDGTNWSEWFQFRTASDQPEPFSFIYFGDAQNDVRSMWSRVIREAFTDAPKARFLLHAGDLINRAEADAEWGEWFAAGHWLNAMIPSIAAPGNHEYTRDSDRRRRVSHHWRPQFAFPDHGPEGLEETCYTLVYQGVRIIVLDSNQKLDQQAEWLEEILESNTCRWVICSFHHPVFSTGQNRDNPELRPPGSRSLTNTVSIWCCRATTIPMAEPAWKLPAPPPWPPATWQPVSPPRTCIPARSTSSRSAVRRCTTCSRIRSWCEPPSRCSSTRSSTSMEIPSATRRERPMANPTTASRSISGPANRTN
jgi:hypothetical protein